MGKLAALHSTFVIETQLTKAAKLTNPAGLAALAEGSALAFVSNLGLRSNKGTACANDTYNLAILPNRRTVVTYTMRVAGQMYRFALGYYRNIPCRASI